mgnify:CR=1 FL=1
MFDLYFIQLDVQEVLAKIKKINDGNGFIRYNVMGNLVNDAEIMNKLLKNHDISELILDWIYGFETILDNELSPVFLKPKIKQGSLELTSPCSSM